MKNSQVAGFNSWCRINEESLHDSPSSKPGSYYNDTSSNEATQFDTALNQSINPSGNGLSLGNMWN